MLPEHVIAPGHWCLCACLKCVSGLRRYEKTLKFLIWRHLLDLLLKYGRHIKEGIWLQVLFYFNLVIGIVASVNAISLLQLLFRVYIEIFSYFTLTERFANGFQNRFDNDWVIYGVFLSDYASFRRHHIFLDWNLQEFINCSSFLTTSEFIDV